MNKTLTAILASIKNLGKSMTRRAFYDYATALHAEDRDEAEYWRGRSEECNEAAGEVFTLMGYSSNHQFRLYRFVCLLLDKAAEKLNLNDPRDSEAFYQMLDTVIVQAVSRSPITCDYDFVQAADVLKNGGLIYGNPDKKRTRRSIESLGKDYPELAEESESPVLTAWSGSCAF